MLTAYMISMAVGCFVAVLYFILKGIVKGLCFVFRKIFPKTSQKLSRSKKKDEEFSFTERYL